VSPTVALSMPMTTHCEPKRDASSSMSPGLTMAGALIDTFSAPSLRMASASSIVRGFRIRSSRVGALVRMPMSILYRKIERVPNDSTSFSTATFIAVMIDEKSIAVITPTITPKTVRNERSLCVRSVSNAILRFS
jgi:hypothetical protein